MIVAFDPASGRILGAHEQSGDEDAYIDLLRQHGQDGVRLGIDGQLYYVKGGAIVPRPDAGIALDRTDITLPETVTLSGVKKGATVRITGPSARHEAEATGRDIDLSFALPGTYEIQVDAFPYLDTVFRVSVSA
ncbi:hypothetical protein [Microvirga sp. TS319]|uniref:hypothetical protein n=1 Tax=Microvirga sp. TS319 TaxID=3241165 RepID=UPI00351A90FD